MNELPDGISHIRTMASQHCCDDCPPERVCAWGCVQGAGIEEAIIGAALALEGAPGVPFSPGSEPTRAALWDSFNPPLS